MIQRSQYGGILVLSVLLSMAGELFLFVYYGVIRYPDGALLYKFLWAIVFCGIGMGSVLGVFTKLLVVERFHGYKAILATSLLSLVILGIVCNLLCFNLDRHFHFFGAKESPFEFLMSGIILSPLAGLILGVFLFTKNSGKILARIGL